MLTTALTVYALFGDDLRLSATHVSTDIYFNVMTILCITVFSVEMFAASLGKDEYFLGFFFFLDLGSTITLILDLTWVWNALACNALTEGGSGALRSSRAGRAGARAARTVRIIRLIRLVKLYKSYRSAAEEGRSKRAPGGQDDRDSDDDDEELLSPEAEAEINQASKAGGKVEETRVGRKLSDMTTRRVILLVLVMLFVMPLFLPTTYGFDELRTSGDMGAELVYNRLRAWCLAPNVSSPWCLTESSTPSGGLADDLFATRALYEDSLLSYIYGHHAGTYAWKLYWVGINSLFLAQQSGTAAAASHLAQLGRLNQDSWVGTYATRGPVLQEWNALYADPEWRSTVSLDSEIQGKLEQPWTERCSDFSGVAVQTGADGTDDSGCSVTDELRCSEIQSFLPLTRTAAEDSWLSIMFVFDTRGTTQLAAGLSMLQTIFICFAVGIGAMSFSKDANSLLLKPIERMIQKMETIKDDPLYAMKMGDIEYRREEIERLKREEQFRQMSRCWKFIYKAYRSQKFKEPMETVILEKTIIKLGGLLALGFGEAGAEIIGHNMRGGSSAGVSATIPGQKVDAIIGFCNIKHFTAATDTLKEKVMIFVNQIGEIVHGCVDDYLGAPNKNIGENFLLVWRLSGSPPEKQRKLADMAIMSAVAILAEVNKSRVLAAYRDHPGLLQRVPNWRVQMGFGLHCGWAIEGAIGSEFKIDASYLSPNVNVATRLLAATGEFDVWLLMSHLIINLCSPEMGGFCRLIDHVTVVGSRHPLRLFTLDLDFMALKVQPRPEGLRQINRFKMRQVRELFKTQKLGEDYQVAEVFQNDEEIMSMRSKFSSDFFHRFGMAYRNYEAGQWLVCRDMLLTCQYDVKDEEVECLPVPKDDATWLEDGPTRTLLAFMKETDYIPPNDWSGHRELTSA